MTNIEILRKAAIIIGDQPVEQSLVVERWIGMLADELEREESNDKDQPAGK
jgi:hypothetical protein